MLRRSQCRPCLTLQDQSRAHIPKPRWSFSHRDQVRCLGLLSHPFVCRHQIHLSADLSPPVACTLQLGAARVRRLRALCDGAGAARAAISRDWFITATAGRNTFPFATASVGGKRRRTFGRQHWRPLRQRLGGVDHRNVQAEAIHRRGPSAATESGRGGPGSNPEFSGIPSAVEALGRGTWCIRASN